MPTTNTSRTTTRAEVTMTGIAERILGCQRHTNQNDPEFDEVERIAAQIGQAAPARICVTCELPIVLLSGSSTRYEHLVTRDTTGNQPVDHAAEPSLEHPMDMAPFAGIPGADGAGEFLARLAASAQAKQNLGLATHAEVDTDDSTGRHPDEPELPSVSLATFQQCVAEGVWTCKTSGDEEAGQ